MLTSPTLVAIRPNVGDILLEGETRTIAPRELTLQFNPGQVINPATLANGISVQRGGVDRALNGVGDVPVTIGFVGIGDHPEEVIVRFAENLPDDVYRITIRGAGPNALTNAAGEKFNNGTDLPRNFRLDLGAVVEGVVPQPVLRDKMVNIANVSQLRDGDKLTITVGGVRRVFEFNSTGGIAPSSDYAVNFSSTSTQAAVAAELRTRIASAGMGTTATVVGNSVRLVGDAFTPTVVRTVTNSGALSVTDGSLSQRKDLVIVHFNEDDLDPISAQDATFYRLVNTGGTLSPADDVLLTPASVIYNAVSNTAVLKFAADLPVATYALRIGSNSEQETLDGAIDLGTLLQNVFQTNGLIGGKLGNQDVDLYKFNLTSVRTVNLTVTPDVTADLVLRLFDAAGTQVFASNSGGVGTTESLNVSLNAGTYYVGVSSNGNALYTPGSPGTSVAGTTTGAYRLTAAGTTPFTVSDANSGFLTATDLGSLGVATQSVNSQIQPQSLPLPPYAGGGDEPGHRDIPAESHIGSSGTTPAVPGAVSIIQFNFSDVYGQDPQGNILHNAITENQKQRAREIFEIWSKKTGMTVEETTNSGIQVITGDVRAKNPLMPPNVVAGLGGGGFALMNANIDWGSSEYGGAWFGVALHEIGHALGLGHSYDLISVMGEGESGSATPREPIFPTDHDIIHIQRLYRPDSTDIDMYQFSLPTAGKVSAEIIAERVASRLDSVLRLYDASGHLLAQNDNYFSTDAFIGLDLAAGTYFVGVSSTGNSNYDPAISDTGSGGTTDGTYQLKLQFSPAATNKMVDAPLAADAVESEFDGDADGAAGGEYEFFFQVAPTIFVDKVATNSGNGTLASPFNNIQGAVLAAGAGSIIRIVGNGGTDGNELTAADTKPYLIGLTPAGATLADGGALEVPQGVTLMIDADAVIKLQAANIDAGTSAQGIDRSNGAIQILGVPSRPVYLTSYLNDSIGGDSNGAGQAAKGGNWGGVVFRGDSDIETEGIFLNYVNKANISFGGGEVNVDSVPEIFTPIHMVSARPTITFNTITNNAKAAVSANPNSFEEQNNRIGPEIHGNYLNNNTINGLFIRVRTELGKAIDQLDVQARFDDDDIVHVITENVVITSNAGGPLDGTPRLSGRLEVDAGIVLKMAGSRIEALLGSSNFIAEGTKERPAIITSLMDDQFGIGGTFDTSNNQLTRTAAPGDWGGFFFNATSSGSIDHAVVRYGGGKTPIEGDFNEFNVIEVHQADFRIGNSRIEFNANGTGVSGADASRSGRGSNGNAVIFVRGAQPIIVNNEFRNNVGGPIINIDVNSLNSFELNDRGRSTGPSQNYSTYDDNTGPLVRGNRMRNNGVNGMEVRGGALTTQVVWDDTDIVHVVYSEVYVPNHHTFSGLRVQSRPTESLVVKLEGPQAGFTAGGVQLDIDDRIGGTVQLVGAPGYPVVMTSLHDDTVGAGFDLDGFPVLDTNGNGNATVEAPGDWRSVKLEQYSNDRNVRIVLESELALTGGQESDLPQLIGILSPNEKSGDDNRPVGFEIHGYISPDTPSDIDVYSFKGIAGSEVWLDLDRTSAHLDSVLELVSAAGSVLARSDNGVLSGLALALQKSAALGGDYYTSNRMDEGFRVILPGAIGAEGTYFVRVRSKDGLTSGAYQLQVRVNQRDEVPGSTIRYSDIRFATNGIEMYGMPGHSPLTGEANEGNNGNNNALGGATFVGDLLSSDRNTLSVSGNLSSAADIDWFSFTVDYQFIQAIAGVNGAGKSWATIFDVDYADGLSRPDTILSVYDETGKLILVSRDSDVVDDQPAPGTGTGLNDLTRGSVGKLDPFIGSVQLPEANGKRYYVSVSSNGRMPSELNQTYQASASDPLARLEPINSLRRIVEDHIGFQGYSTFNPNPTPGSPVLVNPDKTEGLFNISNGTRLSTYVKPFGLSDVTLFSVTSGGSMMLTNPFNGAIDVVVGTGLFDDIAMRPDGVLHGVQQNSGNLSQINVATGLLSGGGAPGIPTFGGQTLNLGGMSFRRTPEVAAGNYELFVANNNRWDFDGVNDDNEAGPALWRLNPNTGALIDENGADRLQPVGNLPPGVTTTGLAFDALSGSILYAVDSAGGLWQTSVLGSTASRGITGWTRIRANVTGTGNGFSGLTLGPQNVEGGAYSQMLFATAENGRMYAFDQAGVLQNVFDTNNDGVPDSSSRVHSGGTRGLSFTPLDFNLWHPTLRRRSDQGHGINSAIDNSRKPADSPRSINTRDTTEAEGGASFYFGLEQWQADPGSADAYFPYHGGTGGQFGTLNGDVQRQLTTNPAITNNYNLPGGAYGSLITNSFSLEGYKATERPTLYFNYFLATENVNANNETMRDAARVYVSADGGTTWKLVATNNSGRNTIDSELPAYASHSATQTPRDPRQLIQELFDNTGGWRQARIDLGGFGGQADLKLRFDFSTSGKVRDASVDGGAYGNLGDANRSLNNAQEGFFIDDVVVGFAGRGEMVTTPSAALGGAYFDVPADPSGVTQQLAGEYQLEIRRGTEYGAVLSGTQPTLTINSGSLIRANERLVSEYSLRVPSASVIQPGDSYTISNGIVTRTFVFNPATALPSGSTAVNVTSDMTIGVVANTLANAINGIAGFNITATTRPASVNSNVVDLTGAMLVAAAPVAAPNDIVINIPAATIGESAVNTSFSVSRSGSTVDPLNVTLTVHDVATGNLSGQARISDGTTIGTTLTVTIPAGSTIVTVPLVLMPNANLIYDGNRAVQIRATAAGMNSISDIIDITDDEAVPVGVTPFGTLQLILNQPTISEGSGNKALTGYVTLGGARYVGATPLTVRLTSTDGSEIRTATTTFVNGASRAFFSMDLVDELVDSGSTTVQIFATALGYVSASGSVTVANSANVVFANRLGDKNLHREQGMVIVESNIVRNFSGYGIVSDAAPRSGGNQAHPGSVRNLAVLNSQRLIPGVTIRNNVVSNLGIGGILFSGDVNTAGDPLAPLPFGKIINNTIYGGPLARGTGVRIEQNSSPTLLNNIVANTSVGIQIDASSASTVVVTTVFRGNLNDGTRGSDFIVIDASELLFVNPGLNNYYPAPGSAVVDSALNSLADRPAFLAVKNPLGLPVSDVVAPDFDLFGQKRQDDESQVNAGLGSDIFKDRGAIERADFEGPFVRFALPAGDNDTLDLDGLLTRIHVDDLIFPTTLALDLVDGGIGIDDLEVRSSQFQLRQKGVLLVENVDYRWRYNPNDNRVYFISVTTFPVDTRYSITIDNTTTTGIRDLAGNRLNANQLDGTTIFTLLLTDGVNDAPVNTIPPLQTMLEDTSLVFSTANNNAVTVDDQDAYLGRPEATATFTRDDGILRITLTARNGRLSLPRTTGLTFTAGTSSNAVSMTFSGTIRDINAALNGLRYTPDADYFGQQNNAIVITSRDLGNFGPIPAVPRITTTNIAVNVLPVNDAPVFNPISNPPIVLEDAGPQTIAAFMTGQAAGPANESPPQTLTTQVDVQSVTSVWTDDKFFAAGGAPAIDPVTGTLTWETAKDVNGTALISVTVTDSLSLVSAVQTFTITVRPVNDAPVYARDLSVLPIVSDEDSSLVNINVPLVTSSGTGPGTALDELAGQRQIWSWSNLVITSGNLAFDVLQVTPDGTLQYRPRKDRAGEATLRINLWDNGASASPNVNQAASFDITITINQINDPPVARTGSYVIDEGYSVLLNASTSYDVDTFFGDTLTYAWDIDNDGIFETNAGSNPTRSLTWAQLAALGITAPAVNSIGLRVTDAAGTFSSVTTRLTTLIVDYGDAPNSYGTLKNSTGAAHTIAGRLQLGTTRDKEVNGQPTTAATGDGGDEDGVSFPTSFETTPGQDLPAYVDIVATAAGKLDAWLDLNQNGTFDAATEHLNSGLSWSVVPGVNRITFTIPAATPVGDAYLRVRISSAGQLLPTGRANDGEVEDYAVKIVALQAPVSPVLTLPVDFDPADGQLPQTTDSTPRIGWTLHPSNYKYEVIVRNSANAVVFARAASDDLTLNSVDVTSSLPPGTYTASVRAFNKAGVASAPSSLQFQVVTIRIASPTGAVGMSRPVISWNHVPGSTDYTIQIQSVTTGANVLLQTLDVGPSGVLTEFTPTSNLALGQYRVRIRATDTSDQLGDWSTFTSFQIRTAPVVKGPTGSVTILRPEIRWTAVTGATSYDVELFSLTDNVLIQSVSGIRTTSWTPSTNLTLAQYRVIVRAVNSTGFPSFNSAAFRFTVAPVPVVINPGGRLNDATPTFGWNPVPSADLYDLVVRRDFGNHAVVFRKADITGTIFSMTTPLPLGRYTYTVRAINSPVSGTGQLPAFSSNSLVTTFAVTEAPVITGPPATTFQTRPEITWINPVTGGSGAVSDLILEKKEGSSVVRVLFQQNIPGTKFLVPQDLAIGTYMVSVRTTSVIDPATVSDWSIVKTFRVTVAPTLLGPDGRTDDATPTLTWSGVLGGQTYRLQVTNLSKNVIVADVSGLNALNYTFPSDLPIGRYRFAVQARNAFGDLSDWSVPMDFQIVAAPVLTGPSSSTFNVRPTFNWTDMKGVVGGVVAGATAYDFQLDLVLPSGVVQSGYRVANNLTGVTYTPTSDLPEGLYRAQVRAKNSDTVGNFSSSLEFYVGGRPVVNVVGRTSLTRPTFTWQPVDGASGYDIFISLASNPDVAVVQQTSIGATSFTVPVSLAKGQYRVWVRAVNAANGLRSVRSEGLSTSFEIVDASSIQLSVPGGDDTYAILPDSWSELGSESTISMLPSFVSGSPQALFVIAEQAVDADLTLQAVPQVNEVPLMVSEESAVQQDEILSQWDQQKWWDSAPVMPEVSPERQPETLSASAGILGAILALGPMALQRRRKNESST